MELRLKPRTPLYKPICAVLTLGLTTSFSPTSESPWSPEFMTMLSLLFGDMAKRTGPPGSEKCLGYLCVSWAAAASTCPSEDCGHLGNHQPGQTASAWVLQLCPWCAGCVESAGKGEAHCVPGSILSIRFCPRLGTPVRLRATRHVDILTWEFLKS